jgi:hypothetical protein
MKSLLQKNRALEALVEERTRALHGERGPVPPADRRHPRCAVEGGPPPDDHLHQPGRRAFAWVQRQRGGGAPRVLELFTPKRVPSKSKASCWPADKPRARTGQAERPFVSFEAPHRCKDGREIVGRSDLQGRGGCQRQRGGLPTASPAKLPSASCSKSRCANWPSLTPADPSWPTAACSTTAWLRCLPPASVRPGRARCCFWTSTTSNRLNDLHGHAVGDLLLVEVGSRLQACVRQMGHRGAVRRGRVCRAASVS